MFINWGNETPEQLAARRRAEEIALMEQMTFVRATRAQSIAVSCGGGGSIINQEVIDPSTNNYVEDDYIDNYFE